MKVEITENNRKIQQVAATMAIYEQRLFTRTYRCG